MTTITLTRLGLLFRFAMQAAREHGGYRALISLIWRFYRKEGFKGVLRRMRLANRRSIDISRFRLSAYTARTLVEGDFKELVPSGGIAVVAHVFYTDLFEEMANHLKNIPWRFDLYISVTSEAAKTDVASQAKTIAQVGDLDVRIVPNRGRDIAPLLVEFSTEIRAHRYVLHIHTKKSLYSGHEQTAWRKYLLAGLLGSEQRIRHIFSQIGNASSVGMIYPDTYSGLPYWAHSWLQNRGIALTLGKRLGIDIRQLNYVDAPIGSMFWAQSDALKPLLDLRLDYSDFPEEMGQADGTLQHTIERFFVLATNLTGMSHRVMLDAGTAGTLFLSPGAKNLNQYFALALGERIAKATQQAGIVSFDIFDTLLVRPWFAPDNLFSFLERIVSQRFGIQNFAHLRRDAERLARQENRSSDVHIGMIYDELARLIQSPEQALAIRAMEEDAEWTMLAANPEVRRAAQALAANDKSLVVVSDMYLEEDFLRRLLKKHDLDIFDAMYVSSSVGKRKDDSTMWRELPGWRGVRADQWVHIGDNEHSDIQRPLDEGFAPPVHVMKTADQFLLFNETASEWIRPGYWQEGLLLGLLANRIFLKDQAHRPVLLDVSARTLTITSLRDFGYLVIGPTLTAFMAWLLQEARAADISMLLYASREGYLLKKAHDLIASNYSRHQGASVPVGSYFLCSRTAACFAALSDAESFEIFLTAPFKGSLAELLRLRIGVDDISPFVGRLGKDCLFRPGALPIDRRRYRDSLGKCLDLFSERVAIERQRYRQYAVPLIGEHRAAMVDIGYGATIQQALAGFIDRIAGGFYFITLDRAECVEKSGQFAKGCFGNRLNIEKKELPMLKYSLLLEAAMTAPHGQFLGFDPDGNPRYKAPGRAQRFFSEIDEVHQGALEFLGDTLTISGTSFDAIGEQSAVAQLPILQVMEGRWKLSPHPESFYVEDDFTGYQELSVLEYYGRNREPTTRSGGTSA